MKEGTRNFLVGTFVAASLAGLGILMMLFGEAPSWLGGSEWELRITNVTNLNGLEQGSPVILNGVEIGRIKRLEFEDPTRPHQGVVIVAGIKKTFEIPHSAIARIYGAPLGFGSGHVDIICEPVGELEPLDRKLAAIPGTMGSLFGDMISAELITSIETAIQNIGVTAAATTPVMESLSALIEPRSASDVDNPNTSADQAAPTLATVVERMDDLLAGLNAIVGDKTVQGDIKTTLSDVHAAAKQLREAIEFFQAEMQRTSQNFNTGIDDTKEDLHESFVMLNSALGNLDGGVTTLARLLSHVESGEGTAGRLIHDDRLYEAAVLALERVADLAGTLQRIFGKVERDGFLTIGKTTPIGMIGRNVPVPELVEEIRSKMADPKPADDPSPQGSQ